MVRSKKSFTERLREIQIQKKTVFFIACFENMVNPADFTKHELKMRHDSSRCPHFTDIRS